MTFHVIIDFNPFRIVCESVAPAALGALNTKLDTIMSQLDDLNAKLDAAKQAAADERTEVLAAIQAIKDKITANDLTGALAKADEVIAAISAVHQASDDETAPPA
jgi:hypothetical protein